MFALIISTLDSRLSTLRLINHAKLQTTGFVACPKKNKPDSTENYEHVTGIQLPRRGHHH